MLNGFQEYLSQEGNIKKSYIPYYLRWVESCLAFLNLSDSTFISTDQKKSFLNYLSKNHQDWDEIEGKLTEALRLRHRSLSTERTYKLWVRGFRHFLNQGEPSKLEGKDLHDFLSHLAVEKNVSASTQNQALNASV